MPQLLLMRHGKAVQSAVLPDRERPLTPRGRRDCVAIGQAIAASFRPDRILCSPSLRTRQTLAALLPALGSVTEAAFLDRLYEPAGDYTDAIRQSAGGAACLLVIGHNPAIQDTAIALVGSGDAKTRATLHEGFPTSGVAAIAFDGAWTKVEPLSGRLLAFTTP